MSFLFFLQKEVYMIAAGVIGALFLICTVVMFLGVKERDGECGVMVTLHVFNHLIVMYWCVLTCAICYVCYHVTDCINMINVIVVYVLLLENNQCRAGVIAFQRLLFYLFLLYNSNLPAILLRNITFFLVVEIYNPWTSPNRTLYINNYTIFFKIFFWASALWMRVRQNLARNSSELGWARLYKPVKNYSTSTNRFKGRKNATDIWLESSCLWTPDHHPCMCFFPQ